jgi:hypothetical protein
MQEPRYYSGTKLGAWRAVRLCVLAIVAPKQFAGENEKDAALLNPTFEGAQPEPGARVIFRAFWLSLLAVLGSVVVGYLVGQLSLAVVGCASSRVTTALVGVGAGVLLWGTLFVRGWQIQTYKGVSLVERVNQWLYRGLYCVGTGVVVWSISWPACK